MERLLLGAFIALVLPFTLGIVFWWATAWPVGGRSLFSDSVIGYAGMSGLGLGLVAVSARLSRMVDAAYELPTPLLAALYTFWSLISFAFLMGLPFANLLLGLMAGLYIRGRDRAERSAGLFVSIAPLPAARFVASVMGVCSGLLALLALVAVDGSGLDSIRHMVPLLGPFIGSSLGLAGFLGLAVPGLTMLQYWLVLRGAGGASRSY